jgi:hypothetical protein
LRYRIYGFDGADRMDEVDVCLTVPDRIPGKQTRPRL